MEKIMKEAIRTVPESIYAPEDTSHFRSPEGSSSALRRIKEEWGTSRWFLEFDIRQSFHTIDRHRLIPIFKEEIDDPKFFYSIQKVLSAGVGGEKGPDSVPNSVLLSALPGNIYLHKLDQEIGRIRQKYEIPIVQRIRSVLLKKSPIDYQEKGEEGSEKTESALARSGFRAYACFNALQDKRAAIVERIKRIQGKAAFHSLVSSWHTTPGGDQRRPFVPPSSALATFLNKPSSLLFALIEAAGPKAEFYGRESCRAFILQSCKRSLTQRPATEGYEATSRLTPHGSSRYPRYLGTLRALRQREGEVHEAGVYEPAGLGEAASEKGLARNRHYLIRICYARYADDLLLGIVGAVELIIEIKKRIAHFLQSGLNIGAEQPYEPTLPNSLEARPCGSRIEGSTTIAARSTVEFLGMVIREVPPKRTPIQFLRELEKRIRVKHRIHITASHLRSAIHSKFRNLGQSIPVKELTKGMSKTGSLLDAVQLAESLSTASVRSPQVSVLWETVKHIRQGSRGNLSFLHSSGQSKVPSQETVSGTHAALKLSLYKAGEGALHRSISSEFAIRIEAPIKKILRRLRDRGLISRRRPWPIHVACLTNVSDEDIVNWSAGIAISPLSYYRCRDNLYQVRTIVDHQIRWSAIFTLAHKHKSSARNIIPKYSKDSKILHHGKTLAEFPNSIELGKLGPRQDTHKKEFR